jgi:hypothetical protein
MKLELRALTNRDGHLSAEQVVAKARDQRSALHKHPYFLDWDDDKAANEYYLQAARHIISDYTVMVTIEDIPREVRKYIEDPIDMGYVTVQEASQPSRIDYVLINVRRARTILQNVMNAMDQWEWTGPSIGPTASAIASCDLIIEACEEEKEDKEERQSKRRQSRNDKEKDART